MRIFRAYSLMELMAALSIVGVLVAMAIPRYLHYTSTLKTTSALTYLNGLYEASSGYYNETGAFGNLEQIGFQNRASAQQSEWRTAGFYFAESIAHIIFTPQQATHCNYLKSEIAIRSPASCTYYKYIYPVKGTVKQKCIIEDLNAQPECAELFSDCEDLADNANALTDTVATINANCRD